MTKHIPNFITSLNLASGFFAIILVTKGDIVDASWLILAAMIFDFMDGFSARLLKKYSEIGKELDSLADVVSFGVAPGLIIYQMLMKSLSSAPVTGFITAFAVIATAIMPVCAALRLAKFNIDTTQATTFRGLPTPACAIGVISIVIAGHYTQSSFLISFIGSPLALTIFSVTLSLLMVTRIPLFSLKVKNMNFKGNEGRYILIGLVLLSFLIFGIASAPLIIPLYLIVSLLSLLF